MTAHLYLMARTAETTVNVKLYSLLRRMVQELRGEETILLTECEEWLASARTLYGVDDLAPATILRLCEELAIRECENARRTIPAVEYDSRLGYEPSMEYMCDKEHLLWKIDCTRRALAEMRELIEAIC